MRIRLLVQVAALACIGASLPAQSLQVTHPAALHHSWSSASAVQGHLAVGAVVEGLSHRAGYTHVETGDGARGWVYSRYLAPAAAPAPDSITNGPPPIDSIAALPKPALQEAHSPLCADAGSGTHVDSATNLRKNRIDDGTWRAVAQAAVLALPWQGMPTRRYNWDADDSTRTAAYEGAGIAITGYIVDVREEDKEATNCGLDAHDWFDWHMWIVATKQEAENGEKRRAIVAEVTPRVRARFPGRFVLDSLRHWRSAHRQVRVSGWLMLDPDHPGDATGTPSKSPSRGTIWEVHPALLIEVLPP
jgi:hypothetical protein